MASGKFIAYYRVSTDRQGQSGLGLEAQRVAVMNHLNGGDWQLLEEFTEIESGKRNDRPQIAAALAACKKHKATLIISKLDRLARSVSFIAGIMESGVEFVAVDNPYANKLMLHIMSAVAEHERELISSRTKSALAIAKASGKVLGNRTNLDAARAKSTEVRRAKAAQTASNVVPIINQIEAAGITTLRGIAAALNARGVRTRRGGEWEAKGVLRVLKRDKRQAA